MSRFRSGTNVIPMPAWVLAGILYVAMAACFFLITEGDWHPIPRILFVFGLPTLVFGYVALAGYVYGDARRRGMRHVMWMLLALFLPSSIGFILYFLLRDPLQHACGQCGKLLNATYPFCPACGASQSWGCHECKRPVQAGWSHCAHCGAKVN